MAKTTKSTPAKDYATLSAELGETLAALQQPGLQVDEAIKLYEQGLALVEQLEAYLHTAENKIETLKLAATATAQEGK